MSDTGDFGEVSGFALEARYLPGKPDLPVLVLLHEGLGCVSLWRDFPDQLQAATQCPVLVYSRPGYGRSDARPLPWPLTYMHDEASTVLPGVLEQLGEREFILVGHSDGASIPILYAGNKPADGLKGLVLMAPHVFVEDISIEGIRAARDAWQTTDLRERLKKHHGENVDCAFYGWNDSWLHPDFKNWDITSSLPHISVPTIAIQGVDDDYGTLAQLDTIAGMSGGAVSTLVLEQCGHSPQKDQTATVLGAISTFITEL